MDGLDAEALTETGDRKTALMYAALNGHPACVNTLIEAGADVNAVDEDGWTALIHAAKNDRFDCTEALLKQGANVNARTAFSETALILAVRHSSERCVPLLLKAGADVNTPEVNGTTALIEAAIIGRYEILNLLLTGGADKKTRNHFHRNAMSYAIESKNIFCIMALMEAGADVNYTHKTYRLLAAIDGSAGTSSLYEHKSGIYPRCGAEMTSLMVAAECGNSVITKAETKYQDTDFWRS